MRRISWALPVIVAALGVALVLGTTACKPQQTGASSAAPGGATRAPTAGRAEGAAATPTVVRTVGISPGQLAPDFGLPVLKGQAARLSHYRGKVVLLNFWATWCGPCQAEVPGLVAVYERNKDRGFTVVAVDLGELAGQVQPFVDQFKMTFPVLLDEFGRTREMYPSRGIPTTFILDREGVVRHVWVGGMPESEITRLLEPLLGS